MALKDLVKNRKKARGTRNVVVPALDEFLLKLEGDDRRDGRFHPSDLSGYFCPRQWVLYNYHPDGKTVRDGMWDARFQRILKNGHHVHNRLQRYLHEMDALWGKWRRVSGYYRSTGEFHYKYHVGWAPKLEDGSIDPSWEYMEIALHHDPDNIKGHTDGATNLAGWKDLIEIKGWNSHGFGWLDDTPVDKHAEQALIYLASVNWMRDQKAAGKLGGFVDDFDAQPFKGARVLYENKNDQELKEYYVPWDPKEYERIMEPKRPLMAEALAWEEGKTLPACNCNPKRTKSPLCRDLTF